ncbi:hypothetical protein T484DRAFT_3629707, partial [Baffinella frigidus]
LNPQPSTLNPQPSTLNPQPSTLNPQPSTLNHQPSTLNPQPSTLLPGALLLLALSHLDLGSPLFHPPPEILLERIGPPRERFRCYCEASCTRMREGPI